MKRSMRSAFAGVLSALMLIQPAVAEAASLNKNEIVYAMLSSMGAEQEMCVVNRFDVPFTQLINDAGAYSSVENLTSTESISLLGSHVSVNAEQGVFYYQGNLSPGTLPLPWIFEVRYYLNGRDTDPADMPGQSGTVEITISVKQNPGCVGDYFDNYALTISNTFDTATCSNIQAENGVIANVGKSKQVQFTVLPGEEPELRISLTSTSFEMSDISINGVPFSMDVGDIDTSDIKNELYELQDGAISLDDGASELHSGAKKLQHGAKELNSGANELDSGVNELDEGASKLKDGASELKTGADQLASGSDDVEGALGTLASAASTLTDGASQMEQGLGQLKSASDALSAAHSGLVSGLESIEQARGAVSSGGASLSEASAQLSSGCGAIIENGEAIVTGAGALAGGAKSIADGAGALASGVSSLVSGVKSMLDALGQVSDALGSLIDNVDSSIVSTYPGDPSVFSPYISQANGIKAQLDAIIDDRDLNSALDQLSGSGVADTLKQGAANLETQADAYSDAVREYVSGAVTLASGLNGSASAQGYLEAVDSYVDGVGSYLSGETQLTDGLDDYLPAVSSLYSGIDSLNTKYGDLDSGISDFAAGVTQLADNYDSLDSGIRELVDGTGALYSGVSELANGSSELTSGTSELASGASELVSGSSELASGTSELADGTSELRDRTSDIDGEVDEKVDDMLAKFRKDDYLPKSFVSSENEVQLVQFVIKLNGIEIPDVDDSELEKYIEPEKSFWDRLAELFD